MLGEGQQFAGYTIVRFLGAGGMGEVYLAQHPRLPRRRDALKLLGRAISADQAFRERFLREADLASTLSHQHIVGVHDRGEDQGKLWIAMDFIDGEDAGQLLRRRYPAGMPTELVAAIVNAVGSALDYAHSKGLMHRDVKPANILLSEPENAAQRRILLTDFGIARALDDISDLTPTNTTLGTVAYSAPEQLMGQELDGRADQYALAATAYQLLTGTTMFPASNAAVVIGHHLSADPPPVSDARPELATLDPVLRAALAKNRQDRFTCCTDFARAFAEQARDGAPMPSAPTAPAPVATIPPPVQPPRNVRPAPAPKPAARSTAPTPPPVKKRDWRLTAAAAAVGLAGIVLAGTVILKGNDSSRENTPPSASPAAQPPPAVPTTSFVPPPSSTQPPPPPSTPPGAIDGLLLTDTQLTRLVGVPISSDAYSRGGSPLGMSLDESSYGPTDHSGQVKPRPCVGVVFAGEHDAYSGENIQQMKTQSFKGPYSDRVHLVQQSAAIFGSAAEAESFMSRSQQQWNACATGDVEAALGYENGASYMLGQVQRSGGVMSLKMATNSHNGPDACQQAMGVRNNVIVETRTCTAPTDVQAGYDTVNQGWPRSPNWATSDAANLATAMLENIGP